MKTIPAINMQHITAVVSDMRRQRDAIKARVRQFRLTDNLAQRFGRWLVAEKAAERRRLGLDS